MHYNPIVYSEHDVSSPTKEEKTILCATKLIEKAIQTDGVILVELTEIVLNLAEARSCYYYFVTAFFSGWTKLMRKAL